MDHVHILPFSHEPCTLIQWPDIVLTQDFCLRRRLSRPATTTRRSLRRLFFFDMTDFTPYLHLWLWQSYVPERRGGAHPHATQLQWQLLLGGVGARHPAMVRRRPEDSTTWRACLGRAHPWIYSVGRSLDAAVLEMWPTAGAYGFAEREASGLLKPSETTGMLVVQACIKVYPLHLLLLLLLVPLRGPLLRHRDHRVPSNGRGSREGMG